MVDGRVCASWCLEDCPQGWDCFQVSGEGDPAFICAPVSTTLCWPCRDDDDCNWNSNDTAPGYPRCIDYGPAGSFCGNECDCTRFCATGFACSTVPGGDFGFCVLHVPDGQCHCNPTAVEWGLSTTCFRENQQGICHGQRFCTENGLTPCDAPSAQAETCNGEDDDCDGETDEPGAEGCAGDWWEDLDGDGHGGEFLGCVCDGTGNLAEAGGDCNDLVSAVRPGAGELCDGVDNNCDGQVDEGFQDGDLDGILDCCQPGDDCEGLPADQACQDCDPCTVDLCLPQEGGCVHEAVECPPGQVVGQDCFCVPCLPDCDGKECGDDGCGGMCGACPVGCCCIENLCMC